MSFSIYSQVTVLNVNDADSITIGGRNLIKNSDGLFPMTYSDAPSVSNRSNTENLLTTTDTIYGNAYRLLFAYITESAESILSEVGADYTFSLDVKATGAFLNPRCFLEFRPSVSGVYPLSYTIPITDVDGEWHRISGTGKVNSKYATTLLFLFNWVGSTIGSTIEWRNLKFERGNRPSDWTPAPEDTQSQIDEINNKNDLIVGTQTAVTGSWTGNASFSSLVDGQQVTYWLPYNGSGNASLNLTLSTGSTTGAIPCYYSGITRLTTHYPAGNAIHLTYRENVTIGSTTIAKGWWGDANYDTNTNDRIRLNSAVKAKSAITSGKLIVGDSGGYFHLASDVAFDLDKPILYAAGAIAAGTTTYSNYIALPSVNPRNTLSGVTLTTNETCYLVGTMDGNKFTPTTTFLTTTKPTSDDGLTYISLGLVVSLTSMYLFPEHPMYRWMNGEFKSFSQIAYEAQVSADILDETVTTITTTLSGVETQVDNVEKSITDKIWVSDITQELNVYDEEVGKTIRDRVTKTEQDIDGIETTVSDVQTELTKKADGTTVQSLEQRVTTAEQTADSFKQTVESTYATNTTVNELSTNISETQQELEVIRDIAEGAIDSYWGDAVPTLTNAPASGWTTTAEKDRHLGDLYYDANNYCYRFQKSGSTYSWGLMKDSDITKAISDANAAQATANQKRRVFVSTPIPPYEIGDLWLNNNELYTCKIAKSSGSYASSDWGKGVKYTDDTFALQVQTELRTAKSELEQTDTHILQRVTDAEGNIGSLELTAEQLQSDLSDTEGNVSNLTQQANEIEMTVAKKANAVPTSIRYIRDWLNGNSVNTENNWVECSVIVGDTNIASNILPTCLSESAATYAIANLGAYTDGVLLENVGDVYTTSTTAGWTCLQLDLGTIHQDIDSIQVWHYYTDNRIYNHRLEVSSDGENWTRLYDSDVSGGYVETSSGKIYYISSNIIHDSMTSLKVGMDSVNVSVENMGNSISRLELLSDSISSTVSDQYNVIEQQSESITSLSDSINATNENINANQTQVIQSILDITQKVTKNEADILTTSELVQDASSWRAVFQKLGYEVDSEYTNIELSVDGIKVSNPQTGQETVINTTEFAGYHNGERVFFLNKDLTETSRLLVRNGIDTGIIKYVPISYEIDGVRYGALAHIKSGGSS